MYKNNLYFDHGLYLPLWSDIARRISGPIDNMKTYDEKLLKLFKIVISFMIEHTC